MNYTLDCGHHPPGCPATLVPGITVGPSTWPGTVVPGIVCPGTVVAIVPLDPDELPGFDDPLLELPALPLLPGLLLPLEDEPGCVLPLTVLPGTLAPPLEEPLAPGAEPPGDDDPDCEPPALELLLPLVPDPLEPLCPLDEEVRGFFAFWVLAFFFVLAETTPGVSIPPSEAIAAAMRPIARRRVMRSVEVSRSAAMDCSFPTSIIASMRLCCRDFNAWRAIPLFMLQNGKRAHLAVGAGCPPTSS